MMTEKQRMREIKFATEHRKVLEFLVRADLAVIERRMLAAFAQRENIHSVAASMFLGVTPESVTPDQQRYGKALNHFALLYGYKKAELADLLQACYVLTGRKQSRPNMQDVRFANERLVEAVGA